MKKRHNNHHNNIILLHLIFLFLLIPRISAKNVTFMSLGDLWDTRQLENGHLFPSRLSAVHPEFAAVSRRAARSWIHLTRRDLDRKIEEVDGKNGEIVHSVCSYRHLNVTFYTLNTMPGFGRSEFLIDGNMTEIEQKMAEMTERRIKINFICVGANQDTYSAVWQHSNDFVWHFIVESGPVSEILEKDKLQMSRGYYPDCFQTYRSDNGSKAIIIWRKGFGKKYKIQHGTEIKEMILEMKESGLEPMQVSSLLQPGRWNRIHRWILWHGDEFQWENRTIPKEIFTTKNRWEAINSVFENRIRTFEIPSISIHVLRNGESEFSAAYGYADILREIPATTTHRYRIASISKLITAMGISELLTSYNLNLLSPVFGKDGVLSELCDPCHPYLLRIGIIHLLEHSAGAWPHTRKFEFEKMEQNQTEFLMRVVQTEFPLFFPGERHLYSNVGYILLGRIISKVSGKSYEEFIYEKLFEPLGIKNATIGLDGDPFLETTYYSHDNANAYTSWNPKRLNSAAGWAMSAKDVSKIFNHLENNKFRKYRWIVTPSAVRWNYGRGIQLGNDGSLYHIGSLAGTEAIGFTWKNVQISILTNIRGKEQNEQTGWMEKLCRSIANGNTVFG